MSEHVVISPDQAPYSVSGPTAEDGFTYDERGAVDNAVYKIEGDKALAPEDGSVVLVDTDTAASDVVLTIDAVPAGASFKVINTGTGGQVDLAGGSGVTVTTASGNTNLDAADGAFALVTHASGGDVYAHGDLVVAN